MRVADRTTARNYLKYLNSAKTNWAKTNARIASGQRFEAVSEDVSSASRALSAQKDKYKVDLHYKNVTAITDEMSAAESSMDSINKALVKIHTDTVKALNKPTGDSGCAALATEMENLQKEILQYANVQYGSKFVFGGTNATSAPFSVNEEGEFLYNGINVDTIQKDPDTGEFYYLTTIDPPPADPTAPTEERNPIPMDGDMYMDIGMGIKMTGSQVDPNTAFKISFSGLEFMGFGMDENGKSNNIYNNITDVIKNVKAYGASEPAAREALEKADTKLVKQTDEFLANLTSIGAKTNYLDTMKGKLKDTSDRYTLRISGLVGTNVEEEATNQTMNDAVLKAVMQMGSRILPLSLMDYLR